MHLNTIIPHTRCYVRRAFLMAGACPSDQLVECELIGAQSNIGRPIQFHAFMRDGATFWNLPIHAFCWHHYPTKRIGYGDAPTKQQLWDCPTSTMVCDVWPRLVGLRCSMRTLDGQVDGEYRMSFDWFHADPSIPTPGPIDIPNERKVAHLIAGDDGLYYALPNNHIVWMDPSWVIESPPSKEDYRAIDKSYRCEHKFKVEDTVAAAYDIVRMADKGETFEKAAGESLSTIWRDGHDDVIDASFTITLDPKETPANGADGSDVQAMNEWAKAEHQKAINTTNVRDFNNFRDLDAFPEFTFENPPPPLEGFEWKIRSDSNQTDQYFIAKYTEVLEDSTVITYFKVCQIPF